MLEIGLWNTYSLLMIYAFRQSISGLQRLLNSCYDLFAEHDVFAMHRRLMWFPSNKSENNLRFSK